VPAYLSLADELELVVARAEPGTRVVSEHELVESHAVSRLTARAALQELERRHLVRRVRGAGTFVARRIEYRISTEMVPSWSETVRRSGGEPDIELLDIASVRAPVVVRRALDLPTGARVTALTRLGRVDGELASLATTFLPTELVPRLADVLPDRGSLFETLRSHYDLRPERQWSDARLDTVPAEVAPHLGFEGRPQAWALRSCNRCARLGRPIELAHSWLRADVFRVVFELGRSPSPTRTSSSGPSEEDTP
jgi:DNA-binding GntR family transcriptional regulator